MNISSENNIIEISITICCTSKETIGEKNSMSKEIKKLQIMQTRHSTREHSAVITTPE